MLQGLHHNDIRTPRSKAAGQSHVVMPTEEMPKGKEALLVLPTHDCVRASAALRRSERLVPLPVTIYKLDRRAPFTLGRDPALSASVDGALVSRTHAR
eukprot:6183121-Pleurochrysis_carterae.AAC.3